MAERHVLLGRFKEDAKIREREDVEILGAGRALFKCPLTVNLTIKDPESGMEFEHTMILGPGDALKWEYPQDGLEVTIT